MTQTNDPPLISSLELIPDAAEKADLDAPNTSGGKLVIGQAPNITITETTVVADATERLALDVQEGDIAIQTNVSTSFIFTGGDNVAPNWETLDFDAVGAIDGEDINPRDITPRDITATGDISLQDLTVAGAINGADTSAAAAGEALTSDGSGNFLFESAGFDIPSSANDVQIDSFSFNSNFSGNRNLFTFNNALIYTLTVNDEALNNSGGFSRHPTITFQDNTTLDLVETGFDLGQGATWGPFTNVVSVDYLNDGGAAPDGQVIYKEL